MANTESLYTVTPKTADIDLPSNPIKSIESAAISEGLPKNFLSFYQNIISFIAQYQKAFEEENFERMKHYAIATSEAIAKYFKGASSEIKEELNGIALDTAQVAKNFIQKKREKSFSEDEIQDKILEIVSNYKEKILKRIKSLTVSSKTKPKQEKGKADLKEPVLNEVNDLLKKQEESYTKEINKFSIELGSTILSKFKEIVWKLNDNNLKRFQDNLKKLNVEYDTQFYQIVSKMNVTMAHRNTALTILGKALKTSAITLINTTTHALGVILGTFFGLKAIAGILGFWGGKIIGVVRGILNFGYKLISGALKLLIKSVKLIVGTAYKIISFGVKTVVKTMDTIFSLSARLFKKVMGFSFLSLLKNSFMAFLTSYAGAYLIGYAFGRLWRMVLKVAGIDDADIASGNYSVVDDVIFPLLHRAESKIKSSYDLINSYFKDGKDTAQTKVNELMDSIKRTKFWHTAENLGNRALSFVQSITGNIDLRDIWQKIETFTEDYVWPTIKAVTYFLGIFGEGMIDSPTTFLRARTGAIIGLSKIAYFAKHIKIRGGIAGLLASAIAIGAGAILGTGKKETEDSDDKDYPLKHLVSKEFASLYGLDTEIGIKEEYLPFIEQKRKYLGGLFSAIDSANSPEERKIISDKYNKIRPILISLLNERSEVSGLNAQLEEIGKMARAEDNNVNLSDYPIVKDILYKNGKWIYPKEQFRKIRPLSEQLTFLRTILDGRYKNIQEQLARFEQLSNDKDFDGILSEDFHIKDAIKFSGYELNSPKNETLIFENGELSKPSSFKFSTRLEYISPELNSPEAVDMPLSLKRLAAYADAGMNTPAFQQLPDVMQLKSNYNTNVDNAKKLKNAQTKEAELKKEIARLDSRLKGKYWSSSTRKKEEAEKEKLIQQLGDVVKEIEELKNIKSISYTDSLQKITAKFIEQVDEKGRILDLYLPVFLTNLNKLVASFQESFIEKLSSKETFKNAPRFINTFSIGLTNKRIALLNEIQSNPSKINEYKNPADNPNSIAYSIFERALDNAIKSFSSDKDFEFKEEIEKLNTVKTGLLKETQEAIMKRNELNTLRDLIKNALEKYNEKTEAK